MKMGGFDLVKWATNSKTLLVRIPNDQKIPNRYVQYVWIFYNEKIKLDVRICAKLGSSPK